jgi:TolB-like protein
MVDRSLDLAPDERRAYIDEMRARDPSLAATLERLLACAESRRGLFERAALDRFALLLDEPAVGVPGVLGGRYAIDREIGQGGMATVYAARDGKHDRSVALKIVRPDVAAAIGVDRFLREITVVARLQHPHIVGLHDSGDEDGRLYYVMPLMAGGSLRNRLEKARWLSLDDALRVATEVGDALSYLHARGFVHRDVKPENILFDDNRALLADFGIARVAAAEGDRFTRTGAVVGTPSYMSPEQAAGQSGIDARADLYSLACVVYEMLAGEPPFTASSRRGVIAKHFSEPAPSLVGVASGVPRHVDAAVQRSMAKEPSDRFASVAEFVAALRAGDSPASSASESVAMRATAGASRGRLDPILAKVRRAWRGFLERSGRSFTAEQAHADTAQRRRVAVVPFENLTGDPSLAVVGRIAANWLSQGIAQADTVIVVSGTTVDEAVIAADAARVDVVRQLASTARVDIVVTGSYSRRAEMLAVQANVVEARTRAVIRAIESVSGPLSDPLVAVNEARERVLGSIVSDDAVRSMSGQPPKYSAYCEFEAGVACHSPAEAGRSRPYFERAIELDPSFSQAYVRLADTYWNEERLDDVDRVLTRLDTHRDRLSRVERLGVDEYRAELRGDLEAALGATREAWYQSDDAYYAHVLGELSIALLRPREALTAHAAAANSGRYQKVWPAPLDGLAEAHHLLGEYREQLAIADRGRGRFPREISFVEQRLRAFAGLRDGARARDVATTLLSDASGDASAPRAAAAVLTARLLSSLAAAWFREHPVPLPSAERALLEGRTLLSLGELEAAKICVESARAATGGIASAGYLGVIAARCQDVAEARAILKSIAELDRKWNRGETTFWCACIRAELTEHDAAIALLRQSQREGQRMSSWHYHDALTALQGNQQFVTIVRPRG